MGLSCGTWRQEVKILRDQSQELGTFGTEAVMYVSPRILTLLLSATILTFSASTNQLSLSQLHAHTGDWKSEAQPAHRVHEADAPRARVLILVQPAEAKGLTQVLWTCCL